MPFRTLADAMVLRNHLIHVLEEADLEGNPETASPAPYIRCRGRRLLGREVIAETE